MVLDDFSVGLRTGARTFQLHRIAAASSFVQHHPDVRKRCTGVFKWDNRVKVFSVCCAGVCRRLITNKLSLTKCCRLTINRGR